MKDRVKVQFATFPYGGFPSVGGVECKDVRNWIVRTVRQIDKDPRIELMPPLDKADTPAYMVRNTAVEEAKKYGTDLLVMIDNDMKPDEENVGAVPFWDSSFDFWWNKVGNKPAQAPCLIAAPYCGPPPHCNVYMFRWSAWANPSDVGPDAGLLRNKITQYSREEAATRTGIERVASLPTGLIIIDMRVFDVLDKYRPGKPYFDYEFENYKKIKKITTEDCYFATNADQCGVPCYCNWDAWAGHWKTVCIGKPKIVYAEFIQDLYKEQARLDIGMGEGIREVQACSYDFMEQARQKAEDKHLHVTSQNAPAEPFMWHLGGQLAATSLPAKTGAGLTPAELRKQKIMREVLSRNPDTDDECEVTAPSKCPGNPRLLSHAEALALFPWIAEFQPPHEVNHGDLIDAGDCRFDLEHGKSGLADKGEGDGVPETEPAVFRPGVEELRRAA